MAYSFANRVSSMGNSNLRWALADSRHLWLRIWNLHLRKFAQRGYMWSQNWRSFRDFGIIQKKLVIIRKKNRDLQMLCKKFEVFWKNFLDFGIFCDFLLGSWNLLNFVLGSGDLSKTNVGSGDHIYLSWVCVYGFLIIWAFNTIVQHIFAWQIQKGGA